MNFWKSFFAVLHAFLVRTFLLLRQKKVGGFYKGLAVWMSLVCIVGF